MAKDNLARMIRLADEIFDAAHDPRQIPINERVLERLSKIHPSSVAEQSTREGPVAWILVLPTTRRLMDLFLAGAITEREMLRRTRAGGTYEAAYLCSALVLPEYRGKGLATRLTVRSIRAIRKDHPIEALFYWPFSTGGEKLAEAIARKTHLPLYKKAK